MRCLSLESYLPPGLPRTFPPLAFHRPSLCNFRALRLRSRCSVGGLAQGGRTSMCNPRGTTGVFTFRASWSRSCAKVVCLEPFFFSRMYQNERDASGVQAACSSECLTELEVLHLLFKSFHLFLVNMWQSLVLRITVFHQWHSGSGRVLFSHRQAYCPPCFNSPVTSGPG